MTEQEAEALVIRLERVWEPITPCEFRVAHRPPEFGIVSDKEGFGFWYKALLPEDIHLEYEINTLLRMRRSFHIFLFQMDDVERIGFLGYEGYKGLPLIDSRHERESFQSFAAQWTPFFRRNCWLSGCPIEASAHEKAEWIQGFSQEELQAWKLEF